MQEEEQYSNTQNAGEVSSAVEEVHAHKEHTKGLAEAVIEEFSAEANVERIARLTKLSTDTVTNIFMVLYIVPGILCVIFTELIIEWLPYIVGGALVAIGAVRFIVAMRTHEYRHVKTNKTAMSLILIVLGAMMILQHVNPENRSAITFISIVWGILGLFEGAHALNHAFKRIANSERCIYYIIKGLVELAVAFLLLNDPVNHETHFFHIIVFGLNLIFDAITLKPQVKSLLTSK